MTADDRRAFAALPALFAALMLASGPAAASARAQQVTLCSGSRADLPGQRPDASCDPACHAGCQRRQGRAGTPGAS